MTKKEIAFRRKLRRDPFGRLSLAVGDYLKTVGWTALIVGSPSIRGDGERLANFEFVVKCTGGKIQKKGKDAAK